jgi:hypothetical protein
MQRVHWFIEPLYITGTVSVNDAELLVVPGHPSITGLSVAE